MIATAGAALMAATQAHAQFQYNNEDLLLNVRSASSSTLGSYENLTIDLGNVVSFADMTGTTVLDTDTGAASGTWSTTPGYTPVFSAGDMEGVNWSATKPTGFTVAAANAGGNASGGLDVNTYFLARATGTTQSAGNPFGQISAQGSLANAIGTIGTAAMAGTSSSNPGIDTIYEAPANQPNGAPIVTASEVSTDPTLAGSFQQQAQQSGTSQLPINFGQLVSTAGGAVEAQILKGGATQYATLYEVPQAGSVTSETMLGYFSFMGDGEITYTEDNLVSAVPEPSTYGMLAGFGLLAVALRRQFRLVKA
jgi:hypothetical protein